MSRSCTWSLAKEGCWLGDLSHGDGVGGGLWLGQARPSWFHQMSREHIVLNLNLSPSITETDDQIGSSDFRAKKPQTKTKQKNRTKELNLQFGVDQEDLSTS